MKTTFTYNNDTTWYKNLHRVHNDKPELFDVNITSKVSKVRKYQAQLKTQAINEVIARSIDRKLARLNERRRSRAC